jgi:hypothetical protein
MAGSITADAADGADGIFGSPAHPDDSAAGMAFTAERDVDAQRPKERPRPPQPACQRAGISGPCSKCLAVAISGPPNVGGHDLLRERHTHRVEIHTRRHCFVDTLRPLMARDCLISCSLAPS